MVVFVPILGTMKLITYYLPMSHNTSISLGTHFSTFINDRLKTGRFNSTSDVVRAGLRLLEEHETKAEILRTALIKGEKSGPAIPFDIDEFISNKTNG